MLTLITTQLVQADTTPGVTLAPFNKSGIYEVGERAGWTLAAPDAGPGQYTFVLKENNHRIIKSGELDLSSGVATIEISSSEPAMLHLDVTLPAPGAAHIIAGAAIAPTKLQPCLPAPADFDAFWESKIQMLKRVPENPVVTPVGIANDKIEYATIRMDHVSDTHVYGQLAKPKAKGKRPALVIFQWASPPYPLLKEWVTAPAAEGWLTLNIEPHDVLPDQPQAYYDALPERIKNYQSIGNDDRDKSYFLEMYLRDYRAVDYIAAHPDWDGKTLVVMGTSMGGQQALCVAGLHPKVTHVIVNEPAGCDTNGPLHGRQSGYPNFPSDNPKIMQTALYFDAVNFAPRIKAKALVAMGFVDTSCPPAGIWAAFNQIQTPKEAAPMIDSPHNNLATQKQQEPYTNRAGQWLDILIKGGEPTFDDHQNMLEQLGVKSLRPGADPKNQTTFDEADANRFKDSLPDVLKMKDGSRVSSIELWRQRRAEILEDFEREVYGRIPTNVPKVTWEITDTAHGQCGGIATVTHKLIGRVDSSAYPAIAVNIEASFTVAANSTSRVPIMIAFQPSPRAGGRASTSRRAQTGPSWTEQAIAQGWGYATINPTSIQPDNNQLRAGIIGLTNRGEPRKPDQWGALRAWQWGASRLIDYFEDHPDSMVDAKKIGIEGLSRYGKAALVTQAFDERIAVALVGSSGEGGAKLHRHIFGEAVENLTSAAEYHWMAGNFIKYGASDPRLTAADLPVDSHQLIALCAPRPCFISYGTVEGGDPQWVDARGSFMVGVLAGPVYELFGAKGFGTSGDYLSDPLPAVHQLIGGELAWRQHAGGHDVTPNWPAFFDWIHQYITAPPLPRESPTSPPARGSAQSDGVQSCVATR
ncbi:hypothetical protein BH09PLA1_BH09PLA1_12040 [soil metagenome]